MSSRFDVPSGFDASSVSAEHQHLKTAEYPTWKVKMLMHLEATDPDYLDVINDGPYMPTKLVPATPTIVEHYKLKEKSEWTPEEKVVVLKMQRVIAYKTVEEIWDALETQCQGTMAIKKNRRVVQIQEYKHFDAKPDENFTDIYDRFLTLLNNLSLMGKVYDREDSNTKFLRALNEEWETQTSIIRHQYDLEIITLDVVYGLLRTHDLEVHRRKERKSNKGESFTLKVNAKASKERKSQKNKNLGKMFTGGERKSSGRREGKDSKAGKVDRSKIKCYNCDEPGHFATECKKTNHDKGKNKALITSSKDWMDSTDFENEEICYTLMASFDAPASSDSKTVENNRLLTENKILKSRNDKLESDLVNQIEVQKECEKAKYTVKILEAKYSVLENELENERKTLKA
ncbi:hypothetical protein AgCh_013384 [Apium graveolens]